MPDTAPTARGVYKLRRPVWLVSDHLHTTTDSRASTARGAPLVAQVADTFLACGASSSV